MRKEDILKLPSMPACGPSYPAGPYRFIDREFMVITYETDPEIIRHQLPERLERLGKLMADDFRIGLVGDHHEFAIDEAIRSCRIARTARRHRGELEDVFLAHERSSLQVWRNKARFRKAVAGFRKVHGPIKRLALKQALESDPATLDRMTILFLLPTLVTGMFGMTTVLMIGLAIAV